MFASPCPPVTFIPVAVACATLQKAHSGPCSREEASLCLLTAGLLCPHPVPIRVRSPLTLPPDGRDLGSKESSKHGCLSPLPLFTFIAPNEKMKQVLKKTIEEAKAIISKVSFLNGAVKLIFANTLPLRLPELSAGPPSLGSP